MVIMRLSPFQEDKAWMKQLLSVACLSLAAKMEETYVPPSLDLQVRETEECNADAYATRFSGAPPDRIALRPSDL